MYISLGVLFVILYLIPTIHNFIWYKIAFSPGGRLEKFDYKNFDYLWTFIPLLNLFAFFDLLTLSAKKEKT